MPELPEVQVLSNQLKKELLSCKVSSIQFPHNDILKASESYLQKEIPGKSVKSFRRLGKFIGITFSEEFILWLHMGMTGQLLFTDRKLSNSPYLQLMMSFEGVKKKLYLLDIRKFGRIFITEGQLTDNLKALGPDPLEISSKMFCDLFKKRTGRIKSLLLNQNIVAGLGNIYADESLYRAKINPKTRPVRLSKKKLTNLHDSIQEVLTEAIAAGGSSIDDFKHVNGTSGKFQSLHRVYGKQGKDCPVCGEAIKRVFLSGRSAHFCPKCQI